MALELEGSAEITIPEGAKPGDKVKVEKVKFSPSQAEIDNVVRDRVTRATEAGRKAAEDDLKAKQDQAEKERKERELNSGSVQESAEVKELRKSNETLQNQMNGFMVESRINTALAANGAADLDAEFRTGIKLTPQSTQAEVDEQVKAAIQRKKDFLKKHGIEDEAGNEGEAEKPKTIGRAGAGGSKQSKAAETELKELMTKMNANRPNYAGMLAGKSEEQQLKSLRVWNAQGNLDKRADRK